MAPRVLVACEESQAVTMSMREIGLEAFSCDLIPCSGDHPEWHMQCDVTAVLNDGWDLMVAHPPCTYLAGSGVQWLSHPDDKSLPFSKRRPHPRYPNRRQDMLDSIAFIKSLHDSPIERVAIENPVGLLSGMWRRPDQIVHPYMFGDEASKKTCFWLKNLPPLMPTSFDEELPFLDGLEVVGRGERTVFSSGKSHPKWYADALRNARTAEERRTLRSKTFPGIARAMAEQWGGLLLNKKS